jgi:hypothetical protein
MLHGIGDAPEGSPLPIDENLNKRHIYYHQVFRTIFRDF